MTDRRRCPSCGETNFIVRYDLCERCAAKLDLDEYHTLTSRQADLLTDVVNALKGAPPPLTLWSHHDAPELAQAAACKLHRIDALITQAKMISPGQMTIYVADLERALGRDVLRPHYLGSNDGS